MPLRPLKAEILIRSTLKSLRTRKVAVRMESVIICMYVVYSIVSLNLSTHLYQGRIRWGGGADSNPYLPPSSPVSMYVLHFSDAQKMAILLLAPKVAVRVADVLRSSAGPSARTSKVYKAPLTRPPSSQSSTLISVQSRVVHYGRNFERNDTFGRHHI